MDSSVPSVGEVHEVLVAFQKNLECSICLEGLKEPAVTKCGHTFCRFCILKLLTYKEGTTRCPLCNAKVTKRSLRDDIYLKEVSKGILETIHAFERDTGRKFTDDLCYPKKVLETVSASSKYKEQPIINCKGYRDRSKHMKKEEKRNTESDHNPILSQNNKNESKYFFRNKRNSSKTMVLEINKEHRSVSSEDTFQEQNIVNWMDCESPSSSQVDKDYIMNWSQSSCHIERPETSAKIKPSLNIGICGALQGRKLGSRDDTKTVNENLEVVEGNVTVKQQQDVSFQIDNGDKTLTEQSAGNLSVVCENKERQLQAQTIPDCCVSESSWRKMRQSLDKVMHELVSKSKDILSSNSLVNGCDEKLLQDPDPDSSDSEISQPLRKVWAQRRIPIDFNDCIKSQDVKASNKELVRKREDPVLENSDQAFDAVKKSPAEEPEAAFSKTACVVEAVSMLKGDGDKQTQSECHVLPELNLTDTKNKKSYLNKRSKELIKPLGKWQVLNKSPMLSEETQEALDIKELRKMNQDQMRVKWNRKRQLFTKDARRQSEPTKRKINVYERDGIKTVNENLEVVKRNMTVKQQQDLSFLDSCMEQPGVSYRQDDRCSFFFRTTQVQLAGEAMNMSTNEQIDNGEKTNTEQSAGNLSVVCENKECQLQAQTIPDSCVSESSWRKMRQSLDKVMHELVSKSKDILSSDSLVNGCDEKLLQDPDPDSSDSEISQPLRKVWAQRRIPIDFNDCIKSQDVKASNKELVRKREDPVLENSDQAFAAVKKSPAEEPEAAFSKTACVVEAVSMLKGDGDKQTQSECHVLPELNLTDTKNKKSYLNKRSKELIKPLGKWQVLNKSPMLSEETQEALDIKKLRKMNQDQTRVKWNRKRQLFTKDARRQSEPTKRKINVYERDGTKTVNENLEVVEGNMTVKQQQELSFLDFCMEQPGVSYRQDDRCSSFFRITQVQLAGEAMNMSTNEQIDNGEKTITEQSAGNLSVVCENKECQLQAQTIPDSCLSESSWRKMRQSLNEVNELFSKSKDILSSNSLVNGCDEKLLQDPDSDSSDSEISQPLRKVWAQRRIPVNFNDCVKNQDVKASNKELVRKREDPVLENSDQTFAAVKKSPAEEPEAAFSKTACVVEAVSMLKGDGDKQTQSKCHVLPELNLTDTKNKKSYLNKRSKELIKPLGKWQVLNKSPMLSEETQEALDIKELRKMNQDQTRVKWNRKRQLFTKDARRQSEPTKRKINVYERELKQSISFSETMLSSSVTEVDSCVLQKNMKKSKSYSYTSMIDKLHLCDVDMVYANHEKFPHVIGKDILNIEETAENHNADSQDRSSCLQFHPGKVEQTVFKDKQVVIHQLDKYAISSEIIQSDGICTDNCKSPETNNKAKGSCELNLETESELDTGFMQNIFGCCKRQSFLLRPSAVNELAVDIKYLQRLSPDKGDKDGTCKEKCDFSCDKNKSTSIQTLTFSTSSFSENSSLHVTSFSHINRSSSGSVHFQEAKFKDIENKKMDLNPQTELMKKHYLNSVQFLFGFTNAEKKNPMEEKQLNSDTEKAVDVSSTGGIKSVIPQLNLEEHQHFELSETPDNLLDPPTKNKKGSPNLWDKNDILAMAAKVDKQTTNGTDLDSNNKCSPTLKSQELVLTYQKLLQKLPSSEEDSGEDEKLPCFQALINMQSTQSHPVKEKEIPEEVLGSKSSSRSCFKRKKEDICQSQESEFSLNLFSSQSNVSVISDKTCNSKDLIPFSNSKEKLPSLSENNKDISPSDKVSIDAEQLKCEQEDYAHSESNLGEEMMPYASEATPLEDSLGQFSQSEILTTQQRDAMQNNLKQLQQKMAIIEAALKDGSQSVGSEGCSLEREETDFKREQTEKRKEMHSVLEKPVSPLAHTTCCNTKKRKRKSLILTGGQKMSLVGSGLNQSELKLVRKFAKKTKSTWSNTITEKTTHLIMKTDDSLACERTLKYFIGVAAKKWVLSYQWIIHSFEAGRVLKEEDYEVRGDIVNGRNHHGPKRARESPGGKLFQRFEICCYGPFTGMLPEQLECIVQFCGATVVKQPHLFTHATDSTAVIVVQPDAWTEESTCQVPIFRQS
ncbi:breast cancer type 1 susceptibility protein isoform X2 [Ahaetulla prasina]|uniref:breast cancer type 1 susceptibility protein isoform X2 n=1 Tax=Ahaetulla prasina TaxID=499056 RepID=UPI00264A12A0|nr:breast cancer type 1 susceptibility protein isoform X2 [Ahaetulla prasina]